MKIKNQDTKVGKLVGKGWFSRTRRGTRRSAGVNMTKVHYVMFQNAIMTAIVMYIYHTLIKMCP